MRKRSISVLISWSLLLMACKQGGTHPFVGRTAVDTGIAFENRLSDSPDWNILNYLYFYNGSGIAAGDFNGDGFIDLYFGGNQVSDRLYLNRGDWNFEDVTETSGIDNKGNWTTGVTQVDINADGLLDIYVCRVSEDGSYSSHNLLWVNQGKDTLGIPHFEEQSREYGLDFEGYSTHAAFFDKDLDGDLDLYLLNHSIHPNRTYGKGSQRNSFHPKYGDVLFENRDGRFVEVSSEAGIYQGRSGYGLGLSIGYLNEDAYPDIYVGNDFYENDYCYISREGQSYRELIGESEEYFGHTTHFSMGNTMADFNRDGRVDILSLDMLPRDRETYMTSGQEYPNSVYRNYLRNGYHPQYMQNTLHLNMGNSEFSEVAFLAGIAATDWSWNALTPDLDNDGWPDLFVTNGILGATNDMDFINFVSNEELQNKIESQLESHMELIHAIPEKRVANRVYRNPGTFPFEDRTDDWIPTVENFSQGGIYADLDNDGDLDLVSSVTNGAPEIWENRLPKRKWLQVELEGPAKNRNGIGAIVQVYTGGQRLQQGLFPSNSYLSCLPNRLHFGLGDNAEVDSLEVYWPSAGRQVWYKPGAGRLHRLEFDREKTSRSSTLPIPLEEITSQLNIEDSLITHEHRDLPSLDFDRSPLVPYGLSNEGPDLAVADFDGDGTDDLVVAGAKGQPTVVYGQDVSGRYRVLEDMLSTTEDINEDVALVAADFDGDGHTDLLVGSAGNEFKEGAPIRLRLYLNQEGRLIHQAEELKDIECQVSDLSVADFDRDGDLDLFVAGIGEAGEFGSGSRAFLLSNNGLGGFTDVTLKWAPDLLEPRMLMDSGWADLDGNGYEDLVLAGHWLAPEVYWNNGSSLKRRELIPGSSLDGLWSSLLAFDLDQDGDLDLVYGNWGLNSKLKATPEEPLRLYRWDFDQNGTVEVLVSQFVDGQETPIISKEIWSKQLPKINKKFLSYSEFARSSLPDIFGRKAMKNALHGQATHLESGFFLNDGRGNFEYRPLPYLAQLGSIETLLAADIDGDGTSEICAAGNRLEVSTQIGRLDALPGLVLRFGPNAEHCRAATFSGRLGAVRSMALLDHGQTSYLIIGINNGPLRTLKMGTK